MTICEVLKIPPSHRRRTGSRSFVFFVIAREAQNQSLQMINRNRPKSPQINDMPEINRYRNADPAGQARCHASSVQAQRRRRPESRIAAQVEGHRPEGELPPEYPKRGSERKSNTNTPEL